MRNNGIALRLGLAFHLIAFTIMIMRASATWGLEVYAGSGQEPLDMRGYKVVHKVEPVYPLTPKSGVMDPVRIRVEVDEAGNVVAALILEGHPLLNQLALDAIKQWEICAGARRWDADSIFDLSQSGFSEHRQAYNRCCSCAAPCQNQCWEASKCGGGAIRI